MLQTLEESLASVGYPAGQLWLYVVYTAIGAIIACVIRLSNGDHILDVARFFKGSGTCADWINVISNTILTILVLPILMSPTTLKQFVFGGISCIYLIPKLDKMVQKKGGES